MQYKTSSSHFGKYGSVYEHPIDLSDSGMIARTFETTIRESISQVSCFDCEVYLEIQSGMAALIVSETPEADTFEAFAVHRFIRLKPQIYFQLIAVTSSISYRLITDEDFINSVETLSPAYQFNRILPKVRIREILGYYYSIRDSGYHFEGESHPFYELTYVDRGTLSTSVEGQEYELKERELIIYGPGQFHTQTIHKGDSCSYITILFELETTGNHYDFLLNKIFPYEKKIHTLLKTFVNESSSLIPYMDSLMLCILQEVIIRLLQSEFVETASKKPVTEVRQHYHDELLEKILTYIDETICEPITIAEICQKFSMSRSSLQILFNENLNQSPKKYINELKLEKSRQMISEDKYTISEIALMLGFNSIHYFSRAFTQKYNMAPSEYSKTIFKN
ncbi:MAG: helix-turn-helix domain-containing protein [Lachnospiraceae bacterium]